MKEPVLLGHHILEILPRLAPILENRHRGLQENAAITLGRLGTHYHAQLAPHFNPYFLNWCVIVAQVRDQNEKSTTFLGACKTLESNPSALLQPQCMIYFLHLCIIWPAIPEMHFTFAKNVISIH